ncbi:leucyl aminopeptidase family protein [Alphaproteobacteria bacterium]|nr:leucyl aminopeptidase family protein [Alphaproteobacteria bacterium]
MIKSKLPFTDKPKTKNIVVELIRERDFKGWLKAQSDDVQAEAKQTGFADGAATLILHDYVAARVQDSLGLYDVAGSVEAIKRHFSAGFLKGCSFKLEGKGDLTNAVIAWGLACYQFDTYKKSAVQPTLVLPKGADTKRAKAVLQSIYLIKNMINTPANDLSPADIEKVSRDMATAFKATISVTKGKILEKEFPLVHMVGKAAEDAPRLIDIRWGKKSHPKLTLVGKGVSFDTGGLNLKPTAYMKLMKKDMGGSAHALALGRLVMELKLPVSLRIIVPTVENSVSDEAFRPGDVCKSRKGITVENTNTDAEGRLILADALTYACEDNPDLLIDFATLTGSARAALGPDIPAMFASVDKTGEQFEKLSFKAEDPVWRMPLWDAYRKHIQSSVADIHNSASQPGDLIYSALFLKEFVDDKTDWVHLDCHAWELSGRPGRPSGAADTGLLAALALIEDRYA